MRSARTLPPLDGMPFAVTMSLEMIDVDTSTLTRCPSDSQVDPFNGDGVNTFDIATL